MFYNVKFIESQRLQVCQKISRLIQRHFCWPGSGQSSVHSHSKKRCAHVCGGHTGACEMQCSDPHAGCAAVPGGHTGELAALHRQAEADLADCLSRLSNIYFGQTYSCLQQQGTMLVHVVLHVHVSKTTKTYKQHSNPCGMFADSRAAVAGAACRPCRGCTCSVRATGWVEDPAQQPGCAYDGSECILGLNARRSCWSLQDTEQIHHRVDGALKHLCKAQSLLMVRMHRCLTRPAQVELCLGRMTSISWRSSIPC